MTTIKLVKLTKTNNQGESTTLYPESRKTRSIVILGLGLLVELLAIIAAVWFTVFLSTSHLWFDFQNLITFL
ncbi:hypothetical protein Barb6_01832 [Bacteroidales bacterium Barb6]|nr:hypothetical protein Barb6_01832 [Bacteroidales bacterium Barb6]OAV70554.1 hypothetical protein Barb4_01279 [Bacteroidales bacterium Barb4]